MAIRNLKILILDITSEWNKRHGNKIFSKERRAYCRPWEKVTFSLSFFFIFSS